jgi:hypothetical protein
MSTDDDDGLTDDQILDLPMQVMPGDLSRLLARIDEQEHVIEKRRQEIEDKAIRLHDGRIRPLRSRKACGSP